MATFRLDPTAQGNPAPQPTGWEGLGSGVLLQNARWFTSIRWAVVGVLFAFGLLNIFLPRLLIWAGLIPQAQWPWRLALVLTAANCGFLLILRSLSAASPRRIVAAVIWLQIVVDLVVLTVLSYLIGPFDTFIAFAYIFHIVLACIFFAPRESLLVALLGAILFLIMVSLETGGIIPRQSVVANAAARPQHVSMVVQWTASAVFIWLVTWYLVATISNAVRRRDRELAAANQELTRADKEKTLHMLRVTHDLKAPFSGIENNIQALRDNHWDDTPEPVREIIRRIEGRATTLRQRIRDILALGGLRAAEEEAPKLEAVDLTALLDAVILDLAGTAQQQNVTVRSTAPAITVRSNADQLTILFANLISNAIVYSDKGGAVEVVADEKQGLRVRIVDHGIGITDKALPHIFEDFYRSKEAASFNSRSTGLGLAIVRQIAKTLRLVIVVESAKKTGTAFEVRFPTKRSKSHGENTNH